MLEIIRLDLLTDEESFLDEFPQYRSEYFDIKNKFNNFANSIQEEYDWLRKEHYDEGNRRWKTEKKILAEMVMDKFPPEHKAILFYMHKNNKTSVREILKGRTHRKFMEMLFFHQSSPKEKDNL